VDGGNWNSATRDYGPDRHLDAVALRPGARTGAHTLQASAPPFPEIRATHHRMTATLRTATVAAAWSRSTQPDRPRAANRHPRPSTWRRWKRGRDGQLDSPASWIRPSRGWTVGRGSVGGRQIARRRRDGRPGQMAGAGDRLWTVPTRSAPRASEASTSARVCHATEMARQRQSRPPVRRPSRSACTVGGHRDSLVSCEPPLACASMLHQCPAAGPTVSFNAFDGASTRFHISASACRATEQRTCYFDRIPRLSIGHFPQTSCPRL